MASHEPVTNRLDAGHVEKLIDTRFPQIHSAGRNLVIEEVTPSRTQVRLRADPRNTRPGGTVSGPAMFTLADFSVYVALIARLGEAGLEAVTTNLNINFLAKPEPGDMTAVVRLLRVGRRLAVGEVEMFDSTGGDLLAHAIATYEVPSHPNGNILPPDCSLI